MLKLADPQKSHFIPGVYIYIYMGRTLFVPYIYFIDKTSSSCDCTNNNLVEIWPSGVIFCSLSPTISCSKFYTTTSSKSYHIFYFLALKKHFAYMATGQQVVLAKKQFSPTFSFSASTHEFSSDFFHHH